MVGGGNHDDIHDLFKPSARLGTEDSRYYRRASWCLRLGRP